MDNIKKSILATVAYYDVIDLPLKAGEVFGYLVNINGYRAEVGGDKLGHLVNLVKDRRLGCDGGYYFMPEREYLVPLRKKRENMIASKMKKVKKAVWWLGFVPYVRAVFASGSLAVGNVDELSDLDVLVVAKYGRIWKVRFLVTSLLALLGIRRKSLDKISPDRICLNHYITDKSLNINLPSMYNAQTYINLKPVLLKEKQLARDFKKENGWVEDYISFWPEWDFSHNKEVPYVAKLISGFFELFFGGLIGDWSEKKLAEYQISRIKKNPLTYIPDSKVSYSSEHLEFHPGSPQNYILSSYGNYLSRLGF